MKIAIFQNFLDTIGGAEVVGLTLARELNADIYTTNIDREKITAMGFSDVIPRIFSIGKVPKGAPLRQQLVLMRFRKLGLKNKYDFFIINGDWAVSGAVNNKPNLWYVNATIREIWDMKDYVKKNLMSPVKRPLFDMWAWYNRRLNKKHIRHIGIIAANSAFTKDRIKKYLGRDSEIIHPPTRTSEFHYGTIGDYWLSVNRLIAYKRVDMQLKAFAKMPEKKLIIVGPYEKSEMHMAYVNFIKKMKPPNVNLIENADSLETLRSYYANCRGFITTCMHEDFGMTAIEAMASGKPVISPNEGGYRETIKNGETGMLIDDIDADKLEQAVRDMEKLLDADPERFKKKCLAQAKNFDISVFMRKIKEIIFQPQ